MRWGTTGNVRVAGYYAAGCLAVAWLTRRGWPWTAPLLWPVVALALVTAGYLGLGAIIYAKRGGRVPVWARVVFAPTLVGQHLSLWHYGKQCSPWDEAVPGLLMGRVPDSVESRRLVREGTTAVVDLTAEFTEQAALRELTYLNVPLLDLTAPTQEQVREIVAFITGEIETGGTVYVHCKVGYSRTAVAVGAYLLASGKCETLEGAIAHMRAARPGIVIRPEAHRALETWSGGR